MILISQKLVLCSKQKKTYCYFKQQKKNICLSLSGFVWYSEERKSFSFVSSLSLLSEVWNMLKSFILMWHCSDALLEGIDFCVRRFSKSVIWSYTVSSALRFTDQIKTKKLWETFGYQCSKRGAAAPSANTCSSLLCVCSPSFEMLWCGVI